MLTGKLIAMLSLALHFGLHRLVSPYLHYSFQAKCQDIGLGYWREVQYTSLVSDTSVNRIGQHRPSSQPGLKETKNLNVFVIYFHFCLLIIIKGRMKIQIKITVIFT